MQVPFWAEMQKPQASSIAQNEDFSVKFGVGSFTTGFLRRLTFRQLQLDAAVALVGFLRRRGIERLELGKARGDQPL